MFLQPASASPEKAMEEDMDISGIAQEFAPIYIDKSNVGNPAAALPLKPGTMTGAIAVADFVAEARKLESTPQFSAIERISGCWTIAAAPDAA